jgi:hypothetical protein
VRTSLRHDIYGIWLRELLYPGLPQVRVAVDPAGSASSRRCCCTSTPPTGSPCSTARPVGEVPVGARLRDRQLRQPHDALDRHHRALFIIWHLPTSRSARSTPTSYGEVHRNVVAASRGSPWRSSTSSPTSPSASTCSTARGACSSRWGGTTHGSTPGAALATGVATIVVVGNVAIPDRRARRHRHPSRRLTVPTLEERHRR